MPSKPLGRASEVVRSLGRFCRCVLWDLDDFDVYKKPFNMLHASRQGTGRQLQQLSNDMTCSNGVLWATQPTRRVESAKTYHEPGSLDQGRRVAHLHTEATAQLPVQNSHALPRRCVVFLPSTLSPWFGGPGHAKFVDPTLKQIEQQYFV